MAKWIICRCRCCRCCWRVVTVVVHLTNPQEQCLSELIRRSVMALMSGDHLGALRLHSSRSRLCLIVQGLGRALWPMGGVGRVHLQPRVHDRQARRPRQLHLELRTVCWLSSAALRAAALMISWRASVHS